MDPRKWLPTGANGEQFCVYCGGVSETSDHTPPRCLLPSIVPQGIQVMTVPSCFKCNNGYSVDEMKVATVISIVSFTEADRESVAPGGRVHCRIKEDAELRRFITSRLGPDGCFRADDVVHRIISRVMTKTITGLLFHEFGRRVPGETIEIISIEHSKNVNPGSFAEMHRRTDGSWAEVTPSGRELERMAVAWQGGDQTPPQMPDWRVYVPECFEFMFIRRSNNRLLTALRIHDSLTILAEVPWPSRAGPRRKGRPLRNRFRAGKLGLEI